MKLYTDGRCNKLFSNGARLVPIIIELPTGGVNKKFVKLINNWYKKKLNTSGKDLKLLSCKLNNFWVRWSMKFNKCVIRRLKDHYPI